MSTRRLSATKALFVLAAAGLLLSGCYYHNPGYAHYGAPRYGPPAYGSPGYGPPSYGQQQHHQGKGKKGRWGHNHHRGYRGAY